MSSHLISSVRRCAIRGMLFLGLFVVLALFAPTTTPIAFAATPRYVALTGSDTTNDCSNNGSPCKTITHALTQATAGDTINIAAGTYSEANGETLPLALAVDVTLNGASASTTIIDGGNTSRVMTVSSGNTVTLQNLTITKGNDPSGGGIYNNGSLTVISSTLSNNSANNGGGIFNYDLSSLTIRRSVFSNNTADNGGGVYQNFSTLTVEDSTFSNNVANDYAGNGTGGGVHIEDGTATVSNSTFSTNSAAVSGGGIFIQNFSTAIATVTNSTFSTNSASEGGGIYNSSTVTVTNSTFSGNSVASGGGGGLYNKINGKLNYANTIIAKSTNGDCENFGNIGINANNWVEDGALHNSCSASLNGDPALGTLGNYGGNTQTIPIKSNSAAIDAGSATYCPTTDQRGMTRTDSFCDLGAFERTSADGNSVTRTPSTLSMTHYGPASAGIQDLGTTHPGIITATKLANWTSGTPVNTLGAWWELNAATNSTGLNLSLELCYSNAEIGNFSEGSGSHFWRYSGGTWYDAGAVASFTGSSPNRCASITGVTDLSRWTLANNSPINNPTAVTLSTFQVNAPFDLGAWLRQFLGR